ncbi:Coenzyme PQQ synthesis protein A [compost metagenome]
MDGWSWRPAIPWNDHPYLWTNVVVTTPGLSLEGDPPMWTKPAYTDLRIGFEVTLYFANR